MSKLRVSFPIELPKVDMIDGTEEGRQLFVLRDDFLVLVNDKPFVIPYGLFTDFASVPRPWSGIISPIEPHTAAPALLHDYAYAGNFFPRGLCDDLFLEGLRSQKVLGIQRFAMYSSVRIFGAGAYRHTIPQIAKVRKLSGITDTRLPLWNTIPA